nr:hypothetical protein [Mesorhizobium sp.]
MTTVTLSASGIARPTFAAQAQAGTAASPTPAVAPPRRFSRPRFAVLVLAGVYPLITALLYLLLPMLRGWAIWQETMLIAPLMVAMMVWGVIPAIQGRFHRFINPLAG